MRSIDVSQIIRRGAGTVRANLDPEGSHSDAELVAAADAVQLLPALLALAAARPAAAAPPPPPAHVAVRGVELAPPAALLPCAGWYSRIQRHNPRQAIIVAGVRHLDARNCMSLASSMYGGAGLRLRMKSHL